MKIALTGATGFIGQHLYHELSQSSHELILLCQNGTNPTLIQKHHRVVNLNFADANDQLYANIGSPDLLIHLAWNKVNNMQSFDHMTVDLPLHLNFLSCLLQAGLPRLVVSGTCSEYGLLNGEMHEDQLCNPSTPYGLAKYSLLRQLQFQQAAQPFELLWTRPFYTYGKGQNPGSIYPQLQRAITEGKSEFPMSGGEQIRDYLPVEEMAKILCQLSLSKHCGIVNVCSGKPVSVRKMVESWITQAHASIHPKLGYFPYRDFEPFSFWGSIKRLQTYLNT